MSETAAEIVLPDYAKDYSPEQKTVLTNWMKNNPAEPPHVDTPEEIAAKQTAAEEKTKKEAADAETVRLATEEAEKYKGLTPEQITAKKTEEKEAFDKTPEGIAKIEEIRLAEEKKTTGTTKTFEDLLAEKSEGKFKTYEDLVAQIKPEKKLKSSIADRLEAYVEASGAETPDEIESAQERFLSTQTIDFTKMSSRELIEYKLQAEHPKWNDEQIQFELEKRYGVDKWKNDVKEYEDGVEPKEIRMQKLSHEQDAEDAKESFVAEQKKWAVPEKKAAPTPAAVDPKVKESYDKEIDAAFSKLDKKTLSMLDEDNKTPVNLLDFAMDAKDKAELSQIGKEMWTNPMAYWDKTGVIKRDANGKVVSLDKEKMADLIYKSHYFDKVLSVATKQAYEKGKAKMIKEEVKNTNFTPNSGTKPDAGEAARNKKLAELKQLV